MPTNSYFTNNGKVFYWEGDAANLPDGVADALTDIAFKANRVTPTLPVRLAFGKTGGGAELLFVAQPGVAEDIIVTIVDSTAYGDEPFVTWDEGTKTLTIEIEDTVTTQEAICEAAVAHSVIMMASAVAPAAALILGGGNHTATLVCANNIETLSGTMAFTDGSTAVVGTTTEFTLEINFEDYVKHSAGTTWFMVESVTDDTHLTLVEAYTATDSGSAGHRMIGKTEIQKDLQALLDAVN